MTAIILDAKELVDHREFKIFKRTLERELRKLTPRAARKIAKFAQNMIKKGPRRTGKFRRLEKGKKRRQRSSARGEWPKERTGDLRRSIQVIHDFDKLKSTIGSNLNYAAILESPELDREHITRAAREKQDLLKEFADKAISRAIKLATKRRRAGR